MQVIDDQQIQAVLRLQAPRLGPHLEHGDPRRVVDVQPRLRQPVQRVEQLVLVLVRQEPGGHLVRIDLGDRRDQPPHELLHRHLEREDTHAAARLERHVLADVERQRRLAHRGARRQDHQVAGL